MDDKMDKEKNAATTSENLRKDVLAFLDFSKKKLKDAEKTSKLLPSMIDRMDMNRVSTNLFKIYDDLQQVVEKFNQADINVAAADITDNNNNINDPQPQPTYIGRFNQPDINLATDHICSHSNTNDFPLSTYVDAMEFIYAAKQKFGNDPAKMKKMLQLVIDWKNSRMDTDKLIFAMRKLLKGHTDLLERFYKFLPDMVAARRV